MRGTIDSGRSGYFMSNPVLLAHSVLGRFIPKIQKVVLDASLLNIQHLKVHIKGRWNNPGKGVVPSSIHLCSSY